MRKLHVCVLVSASLLAGVAGADPVWTYTYDADRLPTTSGSIKDSTGTPYSAFGQINNVSDAGAFGGGIFSASTLGTDGYSFYTRTANPDALASLNSDIGYTVEARLKINQIDTDYDGGISAFTITLDEGRAGIQRFWQLGFTRFGSDYQAALKGGAGPEFAAIDNTAFHTYRVAVLGNSATLYIDGNPTPAAYVPSLRAIDTNTIDWGDQTGAVDSSYELDYLSVYDGGAVAVPEPASAAALSLGALAMISRRRR